MTKSKKKVKSVKAWCVADSKGNPWISYFNNDEFSKGRFVIGVNKKELKDQGKSVQWKVIQVKIIPLKG